MKRTLSRLLCIAFAMSLNGSISISDDGASKSNEATKAKETEKESTKKSMKQDGKAVVKSIEMFDGIDQKLLTVEFVGKDATEANLIFRNQGVEPINVILPTTFGALPVLAQFGPGGGGGQGFGGGGGQQGGGQGMGGGFGGGGQQGGGGQGFGGGAGQGQFGGQGGFFRVEPDKPRKLTVATVCLNHGKADPNPRMKYKVVRLADVNDSQVIEEVCVGLGAGKVSQNVAQATAWHVANGLTWEELSKKPRVISDYTGIEMYFSAFEIQEALRLTEHLTSRESSSTHYSESDSALTSGKNASHSSYRSSYRPISQSIK